MLINAVDMISVLSLSFRQDSFCLLVFIAPGKELTSALRIFAIRKIAEMIG